MPTILELGQKTKAKYPQYSDMSDLEVGQKIKSKYPIEYSDFKDPNAEQPGFLKGIARDIIKPIARVGTNVVNTGQLIAGQETTQPFSGGFLGEVKPVGMANGGGLSAENLKDAVGTGLQVASNIPITKAGAITYQGIKQGFKGGLKQGAKALLPLAKEGAFGGGTFMGGQALTENKSLGQVAGQTALGAGIGALAGPVIGGPLIGAGAATRGIKNKLFPNIEFLTSKIDDQIRKIFKDTTGDVGKVDEMAFKAKKGLELLNKESPSIKISDAGAPLGSKATKQFDIQKSTPSEFLSAIKEMDTKIAKSAKAAAENAKIQGIKVDTTPARRFLTDSIDNGLVPKSTAKRMLTQIEKIGDDVVEMHNWVEEVNKKYGKKYDRGTINDTQTGALADDIAGMFRKTLDSVVDRTGYAEAYGNNRELWRMVVSVAKKANKKAFFGDIATDAGLDAAISILTSNPAYMTRTVASSLFRGLLSRSRHLSGFKNLKGAAKTVGKLGTETKLPSTGVKPQANKLFLPAGKGTNPIPMGGELFIGGKVDPSGRPIMPKQGGVVSVPAEKNPVSVNPKTKKFQTSYSSSPKNKQGGFSKLKALLTGSALTASAIGATSIPSSTTTYTRPPEPVKTEIKSDKLQNALFQLESSGGTNRANADKGELKWLTGLTNVAIDELIRTKKIKKEDVKINNKEWVLKASEMYFRLMLERNPDLSPEEVYVDKYWTQWKKFDNPLELRKKKMEEFTNLIKKDII